jgi:oxygen-independent coproporphyrinogen-3 oxidase
MFSLPGQTKESFSETLNNILLYNPSHISAYSLQLEEGTRLYEMKDSLVFPSEEENREMYEIAKKTLLLIGYKQYEISNFARDGYASKHNLKYWSQNEYIGIGAGASSYFNNVRYDNPKGVFDYMEFAESKELLFEKNSPMSLNDRMSEFMFMGLRKTEGIFDEEFKSMYNKSFFEVFKEAIEKHINNNLLEVNKDNLRLTEKGMDLANIVMCDFV